MQNQVNQDIIYELDLVTMIVNGETKGIGKLTITNLLVNWKANDLDNDNGFEQPFLNILVHAISKEHPAYLYTQISTPNDPYDEDNILEVKFVPNAEQDLAYLYQAFSKGACLNPDPVVPGNEDEGRSPKPKIQSNDLLVKVMAAGVNRADIFQRQGHYPPPSGESEILGLEISGIIEKVGDAVTRWSVGDRVMSLLSGGGYAEYVSVPADLVIPIPQHMDWIQAASIPETFLTSYQALFLLGKLQPGHRVLIHGGASGIGTSAIQLAKSIDNVHVTVTAGSEEKCLSCRQLGADTALNYRLGSFEPNVKSQGGVDLIIDFIGQNYLQANLNVLKRDGKLIILAFLSGSKTQQPLDLSAILSKRLSIIGTTLRSRDLQYRIQLVNAFRKYTYDHLVSGKIKPLIHQVYPFHQAQQAHQVLESNSNIGKVVLDLSSLSQEASEAK